MNTVTVHVVGFVYPDWEKRVPKQRDFMLDVRNYIGKGKGKRGGASALHCKETEENILAMKGTQDCIAVLVSKIRSLAQMNRDLVIVIGCQQGKHRSPTVARALEKSLGVKVIYHYTK